jgi:hypothetical protein
MGSLKPGATYIYEQTDGVTYAREFGSDPSTRQAIGWDYNPKTKTSGQRDLDDHNEWIKIRTAGKDNPTLQKAIDRVKMLYKLSQEKYE